MRDAKRRQLYEGWVNGHAGELYAFAFRLCGNAAQAEDLVQETFYHAWRSLGTFRKPERGRAWLFRILRHRCAHWRRDAGRRVQPKVSLDQVGNMLALPGEGILDMLASQELLQKALDALEDRYKEPFLMVFLQGLTCQEAADALEIPLGTVLSRIHRARAAMREHLKGLDRTLGQRNEPLPGKGNGDGRVSRRFRMGGGS